MSNKNCPKGKILNPATGRCVNRDGKIGKSILGSRKVSKKVSRKVSKKVSKKVSRKPPKKISRKVVRKVSKPRKTVKKTIVKNVKMLGDIIDIKSIFTKDLIQKELKSLHSELELSTEAYNKLISILTPFYNNSIPLLQKENVNGFLKTILSKELRKIAEKESLRAEKDVISENSIKKYLYGINFDSAYPEIPQEINYQFAAVFEYLLAEILETAGNFTIDDERDTISKKDIEKAVRLDKELAKTF